MKLTFTTAVLLFALTAICQTSNFDKGYKEGYKEGYCYQIYGCLDPITPIIPIPDINESSSNYKDGYNRGFLDGRAKREEENKRKEQGVGTNNNGNRQFVRTEYQSAFDDNFLKIYTQQLENRRRQQAEQIAQMEEAEKKELERVQKKTTQTLNIYSSYNKPVKIEDGWHNVVALDRIDFCENRLVRVQNNEIVEYYTEPVKFGDRKKERKILAGGKIEAGKSFLKIMQFDEPNEQEATYVEAYFIDYLMNPNSRAQAPVKTGRISFWTDVKNGGETKILMYQSLESDAYAGKLNSYFTNETPSCGQNGTQTFECSPGLYQYNAWDGKRTWKGTVTVTSGGCGTMKLTK